MADKQAMHTIPAEEISTFCDEIALMLSAGMQLYDGLEALAETYAGTPQEALYRQVSEAMAATGSLYEALKQGDRWPVHLVEMAGVGERTGRLEEVMRGLAAYYSREKRIRDAVVSAVTYPLVLAAMLLVIVVVMIAAVLPVFRRMLGSMNIVMTPAGTAMMNIGLAVGWVVLALVSLMVVAVVIAVLMMRSGKKQQVWNGLRRVFAPLDRLRSKLAASRVFSVLSMMIASGFPMDEALRMTPPVLDDPQAADKVEGIRKAMDEGTGFGEALSDSHLLDELHTRMVRMAVNVGREDEVMAKIAATCEEQLEEDIANLVSIIEPTLVALLCLVIGAMLLSVMLPMAGMIASMM